MHFGLDIIVETNMPGLASNMCLVEDILVRGVYKRKEKQNHSEGYTSLYFPGRTLNYKCAAYKVYRAMKLYVCTTECYTYRWSGCIHLHCDVRKAPDNI